MEFLFSLKMGSFPLFIPGFAGGHTSIALTVGQILHPLSYAVFIMPGYWDGMSIDWNNLFKLLSLGLTQVVLYLFLKELNLRTVIALVFSFVTVYTLRMINLFQFGTSLEAYTGYLILCSLIGLYYIKGHKGYLYPILIIVFTYMLICSGHPEEIYYGLLATGIFTLIAPFYITKMLSDVDVKFRSIPTFWVRIGLFLLLGIMLSSVYIIPFYSEFLKLNIHRVGRDYSWANFNVDSVAGTLNNFFLPLRSHVRSAFGGSSFFLLPVFLPFLRFFQIKIPRSIWILWLVIVIIFLHMLGHRTPIHRFFWEYLPFASAIRLPGRISIIMPFFIMLLLAWIVKNGKIKVIIGRFVLGLSPITILSIVSALIITIYYVIYITGYYLFDLPLFLKWFHPYYEGNFLSFGISYEQVELALVLLGLLSLIALILHSEGKSIKVLTGLVLIVVILLQIGITLRYRSYNWITSIRDLDIPSLSEMRLQKMKKLDYLYYPGAGLQSSVVTVQLENSFVEPFLGKIFTEIIPVNSQEDAYKMMRESRLPQQVFIEDYDRGSAKRLTDGAKGMRKGAVRLVYSSFNRLEFKVYSEKPAIFGLSYPYTGNWRAWVNGEKVRVYRANGAAHAVEIPAGESIVEFRCWSDAFFWGMIISCMTFTLIGIFVGLTGFRGFRRAIIVIVVIVIGAGTFILWYRSLYNGENLKTEYTWTYTPHSSHPNIAYGKKVILNSPKKIMDVKEMELYRSRIVDGDRRSGSGFITCFYESPALIVDLTESKEIGKIVIYHSNRFPRFLDILFSCYGYPFTERRESQEEPVVDVLISSAGEGFDIVKSVILKRGYEGDIQINLQKPRLARYVQIRLRGGGQLMVDEIEVYGR